jgi:hypothetical protein
VKKTEPGRITNPWAKKEEVKEPLKQNPLPKKEEINKPEP